MVGVVPGHRAVAVECVGGFCHEWVGGCCCMSVWVGAVACVGGCCRMSGACQPANMHVVSSTHIFMVHGKHGQRHKAWNPGLPSLWCMESVDKSMRSELAGFMFHGKRRQRQKV